MPTNCQTKLLCSESTLRSLGRSFTWQCDCSTQSLLVSNANGTVLIIRYRYRCFLVLSVCVRKRPGTADPLTPRLIPLDKFFYPTRNYSPQILRHQDGLFRGTSIRCETSKQWRCCSTSLWGGVVFVTTSVAFTLTTWHCTIRNKPYIHRLLMVVSGDIVIYGSWFQK